MNGADQDSVMTVTEVAVFLRLGETTVYKWAKAGTIPGRKIGGTWRFSRRALEAWLQGQLSQNGQDAAARDPDR